MKYEYPTTDDLTFQKYHRQDRNLIITGIPRSGTSLLSVIINGFNNAVCLNEILYDVASLPKAFSLVRKKLVYGETVPNKFNQNGDLATDTQSCHVVVKNAVIRNVDENVLIGSKVNIPYLNQLPFLLTYGYKTICLLRDPVYTIGSWCSPKASDIPEAKVTDGDMHPRWLHFNFRTKDRIERMVQIWSHYAQLLWNYRFKMKILTYESLVSEYKREIEDLAKFLNIENPPANLYLKNGNIRAKYPKIEEIIEKVNLFCPIRQKFGYHDHDTKTSISFKNKKTRRKIAFFAGDCDNFKFIQPIVERLKKSEFETRIVRSNALSPEDLFNHMKWSDVSWFEWANGPIVHASKLPKVCKIVCRLHKYEAFTDSPNQIDWNKVDHFIFVSPRILEVFKELQISDIETQTKVHIIPNAIDLRPFKFRSREKGFNIAYISRFHPDKNPALMIQIMSELVKINPRYRCYMAGGIQNIPLYEYTKHMIKQLSLQENVIYEGVISDVNSWLDDKYYILSTSIIESQGMGIVEGMAKGLKPVIHNFFGDPSSIFDRNYVFNTAKQAVDMILSEEYSPSEYRKHIELKYNLNDVFVKYKSILYGGCKNINLSQLEIREPQNASPSSNYNRTLSLNTTQTNGLNQKNIKQARNPVFSICIPTYNRDEFLIDTIQSGLNQTYPHFELVIIDDGSTDNTSQLVSSIKDPRMRYIKKSHTGAPDTRNRAIKEANGDFIIWLGSDDILLPDTIMKYVNEIHSYPDVDVFYGDLIIMNRLGAFRQELKYLDYYNQNDIFLHRLLIGNVIPDGGSLIRKRLYQNFGGYNLNFKRAHDYEFWARIADKIKVKHIGSFVYRWRWHDGNMSSGSVQFDTSFDIQIKKNLLKSHSLQDLFPHLNWKKKTQSLETAYFVIGNSFNQLKGFQEAIEYYHKCLEINKCESYYCAIGLTYFQLENLEKSIWAFNEALKINPKNIKAREISENLKKILNSTNKNQQIHPIARDIDTDRQRGHTEEIGPVVSVIVPTYNRPQMLIESIKSIRSQYYQNFEIIVVNDGGLDVSGLVDKFQDPRIQYISQQENKGLAAARNTGIRNASGQYIALLDDDDLFYPEHLAIAVKTLSKEIPVIYTDAVRATYERCGDNYNLIKKNVPYSIEFERDKLLVGNISPVNCFVFDKDLACKAGLFDETLSTLEDWDFWIRLSSLTPFKHIPKPTVQVNWRNDGTTMTSLLGSDFKKNRQKIYDKYQDEINQITNVKEILKEFKKIWAQDWQLESHLTSIIILTCNQIQYTRKCIDSIFEHTQLPFEFIVVDNGSTDGTVEYLESEVRLRNKAVSTTIIKNDENKGFAAGNNQGIAAASGEYILLMNNDIVVTQGWIDRLIKCAEKNPKAGIIGPMSNHVSGPQLVKDVDYNTQTLEGLEQFSAKVAEQNTLKEQRLLRVVGFCMLIKRAVIDKIGGMDDRYGLGNFEDDDFSLRATIAGFESWIAKDCFIHHFGHRTFVGEKVDLKKSLFKNWEMFKEKWGLPSDMPYGSPYRLVDMKNTRFDPSIHFYPLEKGNAIMEYPSDDYQTAEAAYRAIQANFSAKRSEEIIEAFENLVNAYPTFALAHNDLGVLYYNAGDKEKAFKSYEKAVRLDPGNLLFQKNLADFYCLELGRIEEALQIYVDILRSHPDDIETLMATGQICVALEKPGDAMAFFNRILEIEPWNADVRKAIEKLEGQPAAENINAQTPDEIYQNIKQNLNALPPDEAIENFQKLVESYPDFALGHNDLGVLYYNAGNKEKTLHHYQLAAQLQPENTTFRKNLADFLFVELGKVEEALEIYVNILALNPQDVETLLITGHICVALKRFDDARDFYNRVLELEPDNSDASNNLLALAKQQTENGLFTSETSNINAMDPENMEALDFEPHRPEAENSVKTASILLDLDGIQNRVKECIKSIQAHTCESHELILINRGATKGNLKWAQQLLKDNDHYHIIECDRQTHWAASFNQAIQKANGDLVVLMHNDVVVPKDWLKAFKICIDLVPNVGVVGPMSNQTAGIQQMIHTDESERVAFESAAGAFHEQNRYRRVSTRKLSDFCLAFQRELPDKIGYFDEQFDSKEIVVEDFCNRAASGGYQNLIAADTYVYHYDRHKDKKSASTERDLRIADRKMLKAKSNRNEIPGLNPRTLQTERLLQTASDLNEKGDINQAIEILLSGIGIQPEDDQFYLALAEILLTAKRFQDAKDALIEMPTTADIQEMRKVELLGYAEEGLGNYEAALAHIERVLAVNPSAATALNLKGILAFRNQDRNSAEQLFCRAIASDPGYGEPYTNLGILKLEEEQKEAALKLFEKGFNLTPSDFAIATNYHSLISELNDYQRAEKLAREAAALYPSNQKIRYLLIDCLVQSGKYDEAMDEIEFAIVKFGVEDGIIPAALKIREKLGAVQTKKGLKNAAVSLCMIVKNEEKYIAKCLASVKPIVDEMIVVDTGSTDRTKDIAEAFGAKTYDFKWDNDFARARNYSISKAEGDWIFVMDADEVISPRDYDRFRKIVSKRPKAAIAYRITTRNYNTLANMIGWTPNDGQYPDEEVVSGWLPSAKVRLFYGKDQVWFEGAVHEMVDPVLKRNQIKVKQCLIPIHHYGRLNKENVNRKDEVYFEIGKKKLENMADDIDAIRELAVQATNMEKNDEALKLWHKLLSLNPNPRTVSETHINLGTIYSRMGDYQNALEAAKKAVENAPDLKEAQYNYAVAELHAGDLNKTIAVLEDLLSKMPDYPPARFILTAAYGAAGDKDTALKGLNQLKATPLEPFLVYSCAELAKGLVTAQRHAYALKVLSTAIECEIINAEILNLFAECLRLREEEDITAENSRLVSSDIQPYEPENLRQY